VTDLQWPWGSAQSRFQTWLATLEEARDDEARAQGVEGSDLAAALVASIRFYRGRSIGICAHLIGERSALEERIERLLKPLAPPAQEATPTIWQLMLLVTCTLLVALALGDLYGERIIGALLSLT
jgi:hypothetical protein